MKSIIVVQARMSSKRFPGKVLKILDGKPVLLWVIQRLQRVKENKKIIIATSNQKDDDQIEQFANKNNIECFRGNLNNVLKRFVDLISFYDAKFVVRISGDSPLIDPCIINSAITLFKKNKIDLVSNVWPRSFPFGQSVEVISSNALKNIYKSSNKKELEHVTQGFYRLNEKFSIKNFKSKIDYSSVRLVIDNYEDFLNIEKLIYKMKKNPLDYSLNELMELYNIIFKDKKLKAGIIGFGVGEQHINGYQKSGIEVVAICDFNEEKRSEAKKKYPKCKIYSNSKDLVSDNEIDIVSIASYDQDHYKQIIDCITSKKHVFCEKPICTSEEELFSIRQELKKYPELKFSTNTILRKSERFNDLYSLIKNGEIGDIYNIEGDYNYGKIKKITEGWRSQVKKLFYNIRWRNSFN